jgi:class 3 adenylate cyclase
LVSQAPLPPTAIGVLPERKIEFRVGIHLGDVVEGADSDEVARV